MSQPPSLNPSRKIISPRVCVFMNLAAFPGLGTIMAGRRIGYAQAALMLVGFFLTMGFLLHYLSCMYQFAFTPSWTEADFTSRYRPYRWTLFVGLACSVTAWLWALASSLKILKASAP